MTFDLKNSCILQAVETELFQLFVGRHLQKPRPTPIWRTRCRFKAYFVVCWGPRLHGSDQEIAGILREGSFNTPDYFLGPNSTESLKNNKFCLGCSNSFCYAVQVKSIVKPGCSQDVLKAALSAMASVTETLNIMTSSSTGQTPLWVKQNHFMVTVGVRNSSPAIPLFFFRSFGGVLSVLT